MASSIHGRRMDKTRINLVGHGSGTAKKRSVPKSKESWNGYALLLVMFFLALLVLTVAVVGPNILMQQRREKEVEMIWRGKQYVRGINCYYQKMHRFPTQLEDLYESKTGIRFMRRAYKDPMNTKDGSWRLISVGPDGRLIGSLRPNQNAIFFGGPPPPGWAGTLGSTSSSPLGGSSNPFPSTASSGSFSSSNSPLSASQNPPANTNNAGLTPNPSGVTNAQNPVPSDNMSTPQSVAAPLDDAPLLGARMIIGVGSKIDKESIIWLDGEKNYLRFEFVWGSKKTLPAAH